MEREREREFNIALRTDTIIRLITHKKNTCSKSQGVLNFGYQVEMLPDLSRLRYTRNPLSDSYNLSTLCKKELSSSFY